MMHAALSVTVLAWTLLLLLLLLPQVRQDIDHRSYMPAAWRVDEYLNQEEDEEDFDLSSLKQHK
jgi:hypothetical protein